MRLVIGWIVICLPIIIIVNNLVDPDSGIFVIFIAHIICFLTGSFAAKVVIEIDQYFSK